MLIGKEHAGSGRPQTNPAVSAPSAGPPSPVMTVAGTIRVYGDRTGTTICINTFDCYVNVGGSPGPGTGTTVFNDVTANVVHTISVTADGFSPVSAKVSVGQDLISTVDARLQPLGDETPVATTAPPHNCPRNPHPRRRGPGWIPC